MPTYITIDVRVTCTEHPAPILLGCCAYSFDTYDDRQRSVMVDELCTSAATYAAREQLMYSVKRDMNHLSFVIDPELLPFDPDKPIPGVMARLPKSINWWMGRLFDQLHAHYVNYKDMS